MSDRRSRGEVREQDRVRVQLTYDRRESLDEAVAKFVRYGIAVSGDQILGITTVDAAIHPPPLEALRPWFTRSVHGRRRCVGNEKENALCGGHRCFAFKRRENYLRAAIGSPGRQRDNWGDKEARRFTSELANN